MCYLVGQFSHAVWRLKRTFKCTEAWKVGGIGSNEELNFNQNQRKKSENSRRNLRSDQQAQHDFWGELMMLWKSNESEYMRFKRKFSEIQVEVVKICD